ncbi:hypothetical protein BGZ98_010455 [Dissophora globulifera]|nr:hypothetical protein BGZ98_010455 [Dissophora globulifera]
MDTEHGPSTAMARSSSSSSSSSSFILVDDDSHIVTPSVHTDEDHDSDSDSVTIEDDDCSMDSNSIPDEYITLPAHRNPNHDDDDDDDDDDMISTTSSDDFDPDVTASIILSRIHSSPSQEQSRSQVTQFSPAGPFPTNVPDSIASIIFSYFDRATLHSTLSVSKAWFQHAGRCLYRDPFRSRRIFRSEREDNAPRPLLKPTQERLLVRLLLRSIGCPSEPGDETELVFDHRDEPTTILKNRDGIQIRTTVNYMQFLEVFDWAPWQRYLDHWQEIYIRFKNKAAAAAAEDATIATLTMMAWKEATVTTEDAAALLDYFENVRTNGTPSPFRFSYHTILDWFVENPNANTLVIHPNLSLPHQIVAQLPAWTTLCFDLETPYSYFKTREWNTTDCAGLLPPRRASDYKAHFDQASLLQGLIEQEQRRSVVSQESRMSGVRHLQLPPAFYFDDDDEHSMAIAAYLSVVQGPVSLDVSACPDWSSLSIDIPNEYLQDLVRFVSMGECASFSLQQSFLRRCPKLREIEMVIMRACDIDLTSQSIRSMLVPISLSKAAKERKSWWQMAEVADQQGLEDSLKQQQGNLSPQKRLALERQERIRTTLLRLANERKRMIIQDEVNQSQGHEPEDHKSQESQEAQEEEKCEGGHVDQEEQPQEHPQEHQTQEQESQQDQWQTSVIGPALSVVKLYSLDSAELHHILASVQSRFSQSLRELKLDLVPIEHRTNLYALCASRFAFVIDSQTFVMPQLEDLYLYLGSFITLCGNKPFEGCPRLQRLTLVCGEDKHDSPTEQVWDPWRVPHNLRELVLKGTAIREMFNMSCLSDLPWLESLSLLDKGYLTDNFYGRSWMDRLITWPPGMFLRHLKTMKLSGLAANSFRFTWLSFIPALDALEVDGLDYSRALKSPTNEMVTVTDAHYLDDLRDGATIRGPRNCKLRIINMSCPNNRDEADDQVVWRSASDVDRWGLNMSYPNQKPHSEAASSSKANSRDQDWLYMEGLLAALRWFCPNVERLTMNVESCVCTSDTGATPSHPTKFRRTANHSLELRCGTLLSLQKYLPKLSLFGTDSVSMSGDKQASFLENGFFRRQLGGWRDTEVGECIFRLGDVEYVRAAHFNLG